MKKKKKDVIQPIMNLQQIEFIWRYLFLEPQRADIHKSAAKIDMAAFGFHSSIFNIGPRIQCDTFLQIAPNYFIVTESVRGVLGPSPTVFIEFGDSLKVLCLKRIFVKKQNNLKAEPYYMVFLGSIKDLIIISNYINKQIEAKGNIETILTKVKGLGTKEVNTILSTYPIELIYKAIKTSNKNLFLKIPEIKPKTAQSIIEALRDFL